MSLVPVPKGQDPFTGFPYLHAYRLVHASLATDSGHLHVAQKYVMVVFRFSLMLTIARRYCDSIGAALKMSAKMSPFYHPTLLKHTKSLLDRVSGSPSKAEGGSWVSRKIPQRPTLDTLWSTLEGRFTSFVAGESESKESPKKLTPNTVGEAGPFAQFSTIGPQDEPQAATSIAPEKPQSHPNLRKASESFQPPVPPMPPGPPPPMPAFQPSAPPASSRAAPLPPGPPPPSLPKAKPPLSAAKKGHSHKRSQSMGFLAYGSDPYASAPSWAPPPAPQAFPEQDEEETENMATAQPDQQNEAPSNGWWSAAGYSEPSEARDDTADASTDNFISPMGSTSASPAPLAQPPSQPTITEEEDLEDLGFGNASSHKRKQEKSQLNATENSAPTPAPTSEPAVPETKPTEQPSR